MVGVSGHHALGCCQYAGRFSRHHTLNEIICQALVSANVPCVLNIQVDQMGKDPTEWPWCRGREVGLLWNATCVSIFAASHLCGTVTSVGAAAESTARKKRDKYRDLERRYVFVPLAFETVAGLLG